MWLAAGVGRAVQQRGANAKVHADLRARPPVPQEVLRPQRYLQISGTVLEGFEIVDILCSHVD